MVDLQAGLLSRRELSQGLVAFRKWIESIGVPMISTNILRRQRPPLPSVPLVEPYHILEVPLPGGSGEPFRIAVLGLSQVPRWPNYSMHNAQFDIPDPAEAAAFALEDLEGKADFVVVLADMLPAEARKVVGQVAGIDLILGVSPAGTSRKDMKTGTNKVGGTTVLFCKPQGVEVGEVRFQIGRTESGGWSVSTKSFRVHLDDRYPQDPGAQELVDRVLEEIKAMDSTVPAAAAPATISH